MFEWVISCLLGISNNEEYPIPSFGSRYEISTNVDQEIFQNIEADMYLSIPASFDIANNYQINSSGTLFPKIEAKAFLIGDFENGIIKYSKNIDERLQIASITKLMTAIVALDNFSPDETLIVSDKANRQEGTKVRFWSNEEVTIKDVITSALIASGNDAAFALSEHLKDGEKEFIKLMNAKAETLGLANTHFNNPVGYDALDNYSSARDLYELTRYAISEYPIIKEAVKLKEYSFISKSGKEHKVESTNRLFDSFLNITGVKTGTTDLAGESFIGMIKNAQGKEIIGIVLNSPDRFAEAKVMLWWAGK